MVCSLKWLYKGSNQNHDPTVYFDIGVNGEEGGFTGSANAYSSGTFIPVALAGGHNYSPESWQFFAEFDPHNSVWNPLEEPSWW